MCEKGVHCSGNSGHVQAFNHNTRVGFLIVQLCSHSRLHVDPAKFRHSLDSDFVADIALNTSDWQQIIVAHVTPWIDCDVNESVHDYATIRENSKLALEYELNYYHYLHVRAIYIELHTFPADNLAIILKEFCEKNLEHPPIWIQIPLLTDVNNVNDSWFAWYSLRQGIGSHHNIKAVLNVYATALWSNCNECTGLDGVLNRWLAEPVAAVILPIEFYKHGVKFSDSPPVFDKDELIITDHKMNKRKTGFSNAIVMQPIVESAIKEGDETHDQTESAVAIQTASSKPSKKYSAMVFHNINGFPSFNYVTDTLYAQPIRRMSTVTLQISSEGMQRKKVSIPGIFKLSPPLSEVTDNETIHGKPTQNICRSPLACVKIPRPVFQEEDDEEHCLSEMTQQNEFDKTLKSKPPKNNADKEYNLFYMAVQNVINEEHVDWYTRYNIEVDKNWLKKRVMSVNCHLYALLNRPFMYHQFEMRTKVYDIYVSAIEQVLESMSFKMVKTNAQNKITIILVDPCSFQLIDHLLTLSVKLYAFQLQIYVLEPNKSKALILHCLNKQTWSNKLNFLFETCTTDTLNNGWSLVILDRIEQFRCDSFSEAKIAQIKSYCGDDNKTVFIPKSYQSYVCPVQMTKFHRMSKQQGPEQTYNEPYVVSTDGVLGLAVSQKLFNCIFDPIDGFEQSIQLNFTVNDDAELSGFLVYTKVILVDEFEGHKQISFSNEMSMHTFGLKSWYPIFFPIKVPIMVFKGQQLKMTFSKYVTTQKAWYEWQLNTPHQPVQNRDGDQYCIILA